MRRCAVALWDRLKRTISARIESRTKAAREGKVTTDCRALEPRNGAQRFLSALRETRPRSFIRITSLRETNEPNPEMIGSETERLLT